MRMNKYAQGDAMKPYVESYTPEVTMPSTKQDSQALTGSMVNIFDFFNRIMEEINSLKVLFENNNTTTITQSEFLNMEQAAVYTGYSKSALYKKTAAKDEITFYKPNGKLIFFAKKDLDIFLSQKKISSKQDIKEEFYETMQAKNKTKSIHQKQNTI